jgi:ATPase subunit of ABC transporter with duplicated ATPase domains
VVTDVVLFKHQTKSLKVYKGDVTNFEAVRTDEIARQKRQHELQEDKKKQLQKCVGGLLLLV